MSINTKLTQEEIDQYYSLIGQGLSQRQVCTILGISRGIIQHYLKRVAEQQNEKLQKSIEKYQNTDYGKAFDEFDLFDESEQYLELPNSEIVENKPKILFYDIETSLAKSYHFQKKPTICVIADTQAKPTESLEYMLWIGKYIADTKPDIVVHIGDHYDMPSLSSYDKGKASSEGRRFADDLNAGNKGLELLNLEIHKDSTYKPRKVFCKGNHENRIDRYVEDNPELKGTIGTELLPLEEYGWEVYDFLQPVEIEDIYFVHYLANPMSGKPYSGTASSILKTVGKSFVVGHKQVLDITLRPTIDGKQQIGIINGACYPFDEKYKGYFGNVHYRGVTVLTEVKDGFGLPSFVSLDYMKEKYYSE